MDNRNCQIIKKILSEINEIPSLKAKLIQIIKDEI